MSSWKRYSPVFILAVSIAFLGSFDEAESACSKYIPIHQILGAPNKVQTFDDIDGFREIKAARIDVNNCMENSQNPTGHQFAGNYTLIGHEALLSDNECLVKQEGDDMVFESMQAIVITANGWTFQPTTIDLDDIDAEPGVESSDGWKESMAIFGLRGAEIIRPNLKFYDNTLLVPQNYTVVDAAMIQMGLRANGSQNVPGGQYGSNEMVNCPFGRDNLESERCRITASFAESVDTLVIMYAVFQKSKAETRAAAFISEIIMKCGCRCSQRDIGTRKLYAPVPGVTGECVERESTSPRTMCDVLGSTWCKKDDVVGYRPIGDALPNGNCPCVENRGYRVTVDSPFTPRNDFILNTV
ncbi:unnamed protein product [Agarophyton chilense]|eukprot:gb/GEZJ01001865.1/.p1 GENE.gb/GEZJ01001865.1/~~gb/GEZJ01001865.1/.p1  ORF type:complete len:356 (+),score=48.88 gb/GEZJ01001865.1/:2643-3710(+)